VSVGPPPPTPRAGAEKGNRRLTKVRRELLRSYGEVETDADYRPAVLGLGLYENSGELVAVEPDVVGPLDLACDAGAQRLSRGADGEWDGERQQQVALVEWPQDHRVEQGFALGGCPDTADAAATRRLLAGRDQGPAGSASLGQLP